MGAKRINLKFWFESQNLYIAAYVIEDACNACMRPES